MGEGERYSDVNKKCITRDKETHEHGKHSWVSKTTIALMGELLLYYAASMYAVKRSISYPFPAKSSPEPDKSVVSFMVGRKPS